MTQISASHVGSPFSPRVTRFQPFYPLVSGSQGLICWKSVTDSGKDHKRKELSARARALRFQKKTEEFSINPNIEKLILVIDGTFNDEDLKVLYESGWDEIYYPDEMNELLASIES